MKLLAVETATEACSAALSINGEILERFELAPRTHTKRILPMIDELMNEAGLTLNQLDGLAFGCGPGSFTGIRIATGVIHGIAFGADLPVARISTLRAMAQDLFERTEANIAFSAIDARMDEIFWGVYQRDNHNLAALLGEESVTLIQNLDCATEKTGIGIGSAWKIHAPALSEKLAGQIQHYETDNLPRAAMIARLGVADFQNGLAVPVEQAMPVYLRDKVAQTEKERGIK